MSLTVLSQERIGACRATPQDLLAFFNGVQVDGVYETHVPLLFRAVMELGNVCAVRQRTQSIDTEFELAELRSVAEAAEAYLRPGSLRYAGTQLRLAPRGCQPRNLMSRVDRRGEATAVVVQVHRRVAHAGGPADGPCRLHP